jgi:hypothetical protein
MISSSLCLLEDLVDPYDRIQTVQILRFQFDRLHLQHLSLLQKLDLSGQIAPLE